MSIKNISKAKNLAFIWNVSNEWELKQYNPFFICQIHDKRYMEIKSNTWKLKKKKYSSNNWKWSKNCSRIRENFDVDFALDVNQDMHVNI